MALPPNSLVTADGAVYDRESMRLLGHIKIPGKEAKDGKAADQKQAQAQQQVQVQVQAQPVVQLPPGCILAADGRTVILQATGGVVGHIQRALVVAWVCSFSLM